MKRTPKEIAQIAQDNGHVPVFTTALCQLIMCSDPWPVDDENQRIIIAKADAMSKKLGFTDWVEAYHGLSA